MGKERSVVKSILWIMALGLVALIAVNLAVAQIASHAFTARLLEREGQLKQEFLNSILATEERPDTLFATPAPSPALASFARHVRSLPGILRANIYSPDGFIRHSTDANLIGVHFSDNGELAESFKGKITSQLETLRSGEKSEHLALNLLEGQQVIEAYIPVIGPEGKVAAVVEFYRRDDWVSDTISQVRMAIQSAIGISALVLVLALLAAARGMRFTRTRGEARDTSATSPAP